MFTDEEALDALRQPVQQRGRDYLAAGASTSGYAGPSSCKYWDTEKNEPSCLVGNALTILGVDRETLIREDETGENFLVSELSRMFSEAIRRTYDRAQDCQDNGATWGDALDLALLDYRLITDENALD